MSDRARWTPQYYQRVLATDPIALWMLDEKQGGIAYDLVSGRVAGAKNGVHIGVTLGEPGIGDGRTSPFYDGANDYTNIYSEELAGVEKILNPGFEAAGGGGADIWANWAETAGDGALADELVLFRSGAHACKQTAGATANTKVAATFAVVAQTTYDLSFWARGDGANAGRYAVYDVTNAAWIVPATSTGVAGAAYAQVPTRVKAPPGCISMRLDLMCPSVNGGICYFDDVSLRGTKRFNGAEGTLLIWAKVANAGVWTDGVLRRIAYLYTDDQNNISLAKAAGNGLTLTYRAGNVLEGYVDAAFAEMAFFSLGLTWSKEADKVQWYVKGSLVETDTVLGAWAGALTTAMLGATNTVPAAPCFGYLAHCALWSKALTPAQIWDFRVPQ